MQLKTLQEDFVQALLSPSKKKNITFENKWLKETASVSAQERLHYFLESVRSKIIRNLSHTYSLCEEIVGTRDFKKMIKQFIQQHPPQQGCFFSYGADFPKFVETVQDEDIPYFKDMAAYEWAIHQASYAPDESSANHETLSTFTETSFLDFPLKLCDHVQIIPSIFPLKELADYFHESTHDASEYEDEDSFEYEERERYFLIYRYYFDIKEEEISQCFYQGLQFLHSNGQLPSSPVKVSELHAFFMTLKEPDQFGLFIQFLFAQQLIGIDPSLNPTPPSLSKNSYQETRTQKWREE